jgi:hypothetical protein
MFKINPSFFSRRGSPINPLSFADNLLSIRIAIQRNSAISFAEICENPFEWKDSDAFNVEIIDYH